MRQTRIVNARDLLPQDISALARELQAGAVAVLPTDTVYGIGTGAYCEKSIQTIYQIKNRPAAVPLQLLAGSVEQVRQAAYLSAQAEKLAAQFWPGALTLVLAPTRQGQSLTHGFKGLGFRVPGDPFLSRLLTAMTAPLACTSANRHGQPVLTEEKDLIDTFNGQVDYILLAGRLRPVASSVIDLTAQPRLLRLGAIARHALEKVLEQPLRDKEEEKL